MRALLLAAGFGTRLRPLTDFVPKCLLPIGGKPLLQLWLERLTEAGVQPLLVNTHYLAPQVEAFVAASPLRNHVSLVYEPTLLGTAGTMVANLDFFGDGDGMLIHADNYCEADLAAFVQAHRSRPPHCVMTMMTFRTETPSTCGILELDGQGVVIGFHEKVANPPGDLANSAIYILSPELIRRFRDDLRHAEDFSRDVIPGLVGRILTHHTAAIFADIGSHASYGLLERLVRERHGAV